MTTINHTSSPFGLPQDLDKGPRKAVIILLLAIALLVSSLVVWMNFATLDISVTARGMVIPSSRLQEIQSLEGGIIKEIAVTEGQQVKQGDLLIRLESLSYNSELGEVYQKYWGQRATIARLDAEINGSQPSFSKDLLEHAPDIVEHEKALWRSRQSTQASAIDAAQGQTDQRRQELAQTREKIRNLESAVEIAKEKFAIERDLYDAGAGSRSEYLSAKQEFTRLKGELNAARINVSRLNAAVRESVAMRKELESKHRTELNRQRSELSTSLAALNEILSSKRDKVERRELRAPRDGIVNRLLITTVGGVARPGETIMELVPLDDRLLVTARVNPKDIAFIRTGQTAQIRVTAFDPSIYGALPGKVIHIGADAIVDKKNNAYFEVHLETERGYRGINQKRIRISPGMTTESSIHTGQRTLMEYLLKPIVKTLDHSLTER